MIHLRKTHDVLIYGKYDLVLPDHEHIYAYTRSLEDEQFLVLVNLFAKKTVFELDLLKEEYNPELLLVSGGRGKALTKLQPFEARVYRIG
jgi:alpha-glucosidase